MPLSPPFVLVDRYEVTHEIGRGGYAVVYRAGIAGKVPDRKLGPVGRRTGHVRYCGPAHPTSCKERTANFSSVQRQTDVTGYVQMYR